MQHKEIVLQAKVFLYHLNNSNDENGMRATESWKLSQVNEEAKAEIEHNYYPTVSTMVDPAIMQDFSDSVLLHLKSDQPKINILDLKVDVQPGAAYFVAFCPTRARR
ncbi:hypothetical protein EZ449_18960 [Pedobacter frigidisoli]|uniref:Uncharacterized protein n=1 Tax=Pedobacter frigidisoli TaxID=2530455 RepID=A0A4R0NMR7_9SPHI|nr:hypothetical protein [Pedobacter frigidisoli]TCD02141.1 hypothetical protein EZ449_18960 [Pedobacter frigidisoli]